VNNDRKRERTGLNRRRSVSQDTYIPRTEKTKSMVRAEHRRACLSLENIGFEAFVDTSLSNKQVQRVVDYTF